MAEILLRKILIVFHKQITPSVGNRQMTIVIFCVFNHFLTKQLKGEPLGSETSINKLHRAELEIEFGELALELQGSAAAYIAGSGAAIDSGRWQYASLSWPEVVIGGGTPNIQKNIIAERILGLPKD